MLPQIRCLITMRVESSILSYRQKYSRQYYQEGHQSIAGKVQVQEWRVTPTLTVYSCDDFPSRIT